MAENNGVQTMKATEELQDFFGRLGLMQAEISWFLFTLGQLGAMTQIDQRAARAAIKLMRGDVADFTKSAAALSEKMSELLDNAEGNMTGGEDEAV